jgi:uncharacterized cofD-like protein
MKKIVTVGGGTGSYTVLSGLKHVPDITITALVSMADDGGSTGVLRDELGVLPPGDVRQCLIALSEHDEVVRKLMGYRFQEGSLSGHSFGNIFLAALEKVSGNFIEGVKVASEILKVKGTVIPVTDNHAELVMKLSDGTMLFGENEINHALIQEKGVLEMGYKHPVTLNDSARKAILDADCVILGPGNYYCSLLPNIIVDGFKEAICETKARIIFPVNLTNKQGHTMHWGIREYVTDLEKRIGRKVDCVLINSKFPSEEQVVLYELQEGDGVLVLDDYEDGNVLRTPLLSHVLVARQEGDSLAATRSFIRHDSQQLAKVIINYIHTYNESDF